MQLEIFTIQFLDKQHGDLFNVTWFFRDEYMARNFANEIIFSQGIIGRSEDYRSIYASQKHTEIRSVKKGWSDSSFPACRAPMACSLRMRSQKRPRSIPNVSTPLFDLFR